jgi:mono/diheme cytochrome c family protein
VEKGSIGYLHNCAGCHGLKAVSGGMAPDLLAAEQECRGMASKPDQDSCLKETDSRFKDIVLDGKKNSEGRSVMPGYGGVFTQAAVWAVKAYIDSRAAEESGN